ncbi:MAG TPA: alpha/beta fold hydrolase [Allosphingosinicella sp.]|nr:alpha/beta fold hydrolase [Allosphingosinicella sp.]
MGKLLFVPVLLYLAFVALLFFAQTSILFPVRQVGPPAALPAGAERLEIALRPDLRLRGVRIPPGRPTARTTLILGFGGNAANAATTAVVLHQVFPEAEVVSFSYRGYPPSDGVPGASALREDAVRILDELRLRLRPGRVVAVGFSVGSGVAAALAAERELDGLILVTPFDSLARVAADHYPWVPVRLLLRHRLDPALDLGSARTPVAIIAAGRDTLIPAARTGALRAAVANLAYDRTLAAGHNDIYDHPAFAAAMHEALAALSSASP